MRVQLSIRTTTYNNDYHELISDEKGVFTSDAFSRAREHAYATVEGAKLSLFAAMDGDDVFFGGWLNVKEYTTRNVINSKYANTARDGENATKTCLVFHAAKSDMKKLLATAELAISETLLLDLWKTYVTDEVWQSESDDCVLYPSAEIDIPECNEGYYKAFYDKLYELGQNEGVFPVMHIKQAFSVLNLIINNLIRWDIEKYEATIYVPAGIDSALDRTAVFYLNDSDNRFIIALKLGLYCAKKGYKFERNALLEIVEASRNNLHTAKEIADYVAKKSGGIKITAEICIRLMDENRVGYNGLTAEDMAALKLIGANYTSEQIAGALKMDDIRYANQVASFLLSSGYATSNGKVIRITKKGKEILASEAIIAFIKADDVGNITDAALQVANDEALTEETESEIIVCEAEGNETLTTDENGGEISVEEGEGV